MVNQKLMNTYEDIVGHVKNKTAQIVDTRRPENYNAKKDEPNICETYHLLLIILLQFQSYSLLLLSL